MASMSSGNKRPPSGKGGTAGMSEGPLNLTIVGSAVDTSTTAHIVSRPSSGGLNKSVSVTGGTRIPKPTDVYAAAVADLKDADSRPLSHLHQIRTTVNTPSSPIRKRASSAYAPGALPSLPPSPSGNANLGRGSSFKSLLDGPCNHSILSTPNRADDSQLQAVGHAVNAAHKEVEIPAMVLSPGSRRVTSAPDSQSAFLMHQGQGADAWRTTFYNEPLRTGPGVASLHASPQQHGAARYDHTGTSTSSAVHSVSGRVMSPAQTNTVSPGRTSNSSINNHNSAFSSPKKDILSSPPGVMSRVNTPPTSTGGTAGLTGQLPRTPPRGTSRIPTSPTSHSQIPTLYTHAALTNSPGVGHTTLTAGITPTKLPINTDTIDMPSAFELVQQLSDSQAPGVAFSLRQRSTTGGFENTSGASTPTSTPPGSGFWPRPPCDVSAATSGRLGSPPLHTRRRSLMSSPDSRHQSPRQVHQQDPSDDAFFLQPSLPFSHNDDALLPSASQAPSRHDAQSSARRRLELTNNTQFKDSPATTPELPVTLASSSSGTVDSSTIPSAVVRCIAASCGPTGTGPPTIMSAQREQEIQSQQTGDAHVQPAQDSRDNHTNHNVLVARVSSSSGPLLTPALSKVLLDSAGNSQANTPTSRPASGRVKPVQLLIDAVRSRDFARFTAALDSLRLSDGRIAGLNERHAVTGRTPLHEAVMLGSVDVVKALLSAGADPLIGHMSQGPPLLHAAAWGETAMIKLFIEAGHGSDLHAKDIAGYTALHYACAGGHLEAAWLLLEAGSDPRAESHEGDTPMSLAADHPALLEQVFSNIKDNASDKAVSSPDMTHHHRDSTNAVLATSFSAGLGIANVDAHAEKSGGLASPHTQHTQPAEVQLIQFGVPPSPSGMSRLRSVSISSRSRFSPPASLSPHSNQQTPPSTTTQPHSMSDQTPTAIHTAQKVPGAENNAEQGTKDRVETERTATVDSAAAAAAESSPVSFGGSSAFEAPAPPVVQLPRGVRRQLSGLVLQDIIHAFQDDDAELVSKHSTGHISLLDTYQQGQAAATEGSGDTSKERAPSKPAAGSHREPTTAMRSRQRLKSDGARPASPAITFGVPLSSQQAQQLNGNDSQSRPPSAAMQHFASQRWNTTGGVPPGGVPTNNTNVYGMPQSPSGGLAAAVPIAPKFRFGIDIHQNPPAVMIAPAPSSTGLDGESALESRLSRLPSRQGTPRAPARHEPLRRSLSAPEDGIPPADLQYLSPQIPGADAGRAGQEYDGQEKTAMAGGSGDSVNQRSTLALNGACEGTRPSSARRRMRLGLGMRSSVSTGGYIEASGRGEQEQANTEQAMPPNQGNIDDPSGNADVARPGSTPMEDTEPRERRNSSGSADMYNTSGDIPPPLVKTHSPPSSPKLNSSLRRRNAAAAAAGGSGNERLKSHTQDHAAALDPGLLPLPSSGLGMRPKLPNQRVLQHSVSDVDGSILKERRSHGITRRSSHGAQQLGKRPSQPWLATGAPTDPVRISQAANALVAQTSGTGASHEALQLRAVQMFSRSVELQTGGLKWTRGELLGQGSFGRVYAGLNQETGELMAVKVLELLQLRNGAAKEAAYEQLNALIQELDLYKKLSHRHVVSYFGHHFDASAYTLYIFLEYVPGGSIASMLSRFGRFSEDLVRNYTRQLLLGLEYLHNSRVVHRDLKGGNVLVTRDGVIKLADFGASKACSTDTINKGMKSIKGSAFWMAPEVIKSIGYNLKADVWSLGCTVIEMLTGKHPWPNLENPVSAMFTIANTLEGPPRPTTASPVALDFLDACLKYEPSERASVADLLAHPFVAAADTPRPKATDA